VSRVAAAVGTLLLTPYLLHHLGAERYGIWLLALTVTFSNGFLSFGDAGLPEAAIRFIAEARARDDESEIGAIVSSLLVLYVPLGFVIGGLLVLLASTFVHAFGIRSELAQVSVWVFALAGAQVVFDLPAAAFQAVLQGLQRYGAYQAIQVGGTVAWVVGTFAVVHARHGILGLALVAFAVAFAELVASVVLAFFVDRGLRLGVRRVSRRILRQLLGYGSSVLGMRIMSILWNQSDRIVIALLVSTVAVAHYQIAYQVQAVVLLTLSVSASAVLPASAHVRASGDQNTERAIYLLGTRYAVAICMPVLIATLVYAHAIIATWVGPTYVYLSGASRLFVLTLLISIFNTVGLTMFVGIGRIKPILIVNAVATGINVVLSVLLAPALGITGVILGTLIAFIPTNVTYFVLFAKEFHSSARRFLKEIILPNAPGAIAQIAFALATVTWCDQQHKLWQVGAICTASVMVSGLFFLLFSPPGQRAGLLRLVRRSAAASPTGGPIDL
jgi:O-antigen/teichoic acid export membrane protein